MSQSEIDFFNSLAEGWDEYRAADHVKITRLVRQIGLYAGDKVLDIGCGTGVLLPFVKKEIGEQGKITAVDFAANMVACAAEKNRKCFGISYVVSDIMEFQTEVLFDKAICFNFFPHAKHKAELVSRIREMLVVGGSVIIMHDMSRAKVNAIHHGSATVHNDCLPDSVTVGKMLRKAGYELELAVDNDELYFIKAVKK